MIEDDTVVKGEQMRAAQFRGILPIAFFLVLIFSVIHSAVAQTCFPMLISTFPSGVERGKTITVTINTGTVNGGGGANLYGAYKVMVDGEGVQAEIVPPEKGWPVKDPKTPMPSRSSPPSE